RRKGDADAWAAPAAAGRPERRVARSWCLLRLLDQQHLVDLVDLDELHLHALLARGGQVLADVVGANGKLAVAAVGEHRELDARGPAVLEQCVDRGTDRSPGVEDVVDE